MLTQEMNKIFKHLPPDNKGGSLAFYGCWLGGRPDGIAMLLSSFCTSRALILEFTEGKRLEINDPAEIEVMDDALIIWRASSLIFYFSPTGKPQPLDKCFHYIFKVSRTNIQFHTNHMHPLMPNFRMPAFEMAWSVPHDCSGPEYCRERGEVRLPK